jgi:preprotein translocase subunit YajC
MKTMEKVVLAQTNGLGMIGMVGYLVFLFGMMWFFIIRPQKKKDKELKEMQNSMKAGDKVLLQNGLYGKIVDKINNVFIIEFGLNKGVRIPVQQSAVIGIAEPNLSLKPVKKVEEDFDDEDDEDEDEE